MTASLVGARGSIARRHSVDDVSVTVDSFIEGGALAVNFVGDNDTHSISITRAS